MSVVLLNQEIVHYEVLGRGRPLILLHGWVGSWRYWIPVMQAASVSYRAYALDLYGFGDSSKKPNLYSVEQQCNLLESFLEEMGIGRVALIGHGLGGVVALLAAQRNPQTVDRFMAVSCPLDESMVSGRLRSGSPVDLADWLLGRGSLMEPVRADAPKTDTSALQASFADGSLARLRDSWRGIKTSCLLVNGQNDPAVDPPQIEQMADLPEQMHAVQFDQSGHFPMLDESSKFNRLMIDFLTLPSGESPRQLQLKEEWKRRVR
jgi:pimeloyl-ACP methyl ester carboxylesterase